MNRRRFHRAVFALAGLYNLGWGGYSALDPQWFFRFSGLAPSNHPEVFACLGMVVGLYGFLYLEVARDPESGWLVLMLFAPEFVVAGERGAGAGVMPLS